MDLCDCDMEMRMFVLETMFSFSSLVDDANVRNVYTKISIVISC